MVSEMTNNTIDALLRNGVTKIVESHAAASLQLVPTNAYGLRPFYDKHKSTDLR